MRACRACHPLFAMSFASSRAEPRHSRSCVPCPVRYARTPIFFPPIFSRTSVCAVDGFGPGGASLSVALRRVAARRSHRRQRTRHPGTGRLQQAHARHYSRVDGPPRAPRRCKGGRVGIGGIGRAGCRRCRRHAQLGSGRPSPHRCTELGCALVCWVDGALDVLEVVRAAA